MWVIDIRHWLDETQSCSAEPQLKSKVDKIAEIITYATSVEAGISLDSSSCCRNQKEGPVIDCWVSG